MIKNFLQGFGDLIALAVLLCVLLFTCHSGQQAHAASISLNKERAVAIEGPIGGGNILHLAPKMLSLAGDGTGEPIDLVISSPGGKIVTGFLFINLMESIKARGTVIRCFVPTIAASMAFQILIHCDERYALSKSFLLWHRVRVVGGSAPITAPLAALLAQDLERADRIILNEVLESMDDVSPDTLLGHFNNETLHFASDLAVLSPKFLTVLEAVPDLLEFLVTTPRTGPVGRLRQGDIIYQKGL